MWSPSIYVERVRVKGWAFRATTSTSSAISAWSTSGCPRSTSSCGRRRGHKFRFQYIPIKYEASSTLNQDIVFNGIRYRLGAAGEIDARLEDLLASATSSISSRRTAGFAGFILEAKYTDVQVALDSPI